MSDASLIERDYSKAFTADELGGTPLERIELPRLRVPSGTIVACDPWIEEDIEPFEQQVPPGDYRVELAMATVRLERGESQQVPAFVRVVLGETPATRWVMATLPRQSLDELQPGYRYCHGVDSGVSSFMDPLAHEVLLDEYADMEGDVDEPALLSELRAAMRGPVTGRHGAVDIRLEDEPMTNIVAFSSGAGDGCYSCYWGYAADGSVVELLTDFAVIREL